MSAGLAIGQAVTLPRPTLDVSTGVVVGLGPCPYPRCPHGANCVGVRITTGRGVHTINFHAAELQPAGEECTMDERTEYRLPPAFYDDHVSRDLPAGVVRRRTKSYVIVALTPDERAELLSDARHYADPATRDAMPPYLFGVHRSAVATVRALTKAVGS